MRITTVLFDLDGTLLPMDQDVFINGYFKHLAKNMAVHGYDPKQLIDAVWTGTMKMIKNNGERTNEAVFWDKFAELFGEEKRKDEALFAKFYENHFCDVKETCGYDPKAAEAVAEIKKMGLRVALATNPVFPAIATEQRIRWAGLEPDAFELYTTYENSSYSKPNPKYYQAIIEKLGVDPASCMMVGNDVTEDMIAGTLGMKVFLLTDNLINKENKDIDQYPHGGFDELMAHIRKIGRAHV